MVHPLLEYGCVLIESAKRKYVSQLDKLQNRALHLIDYNYGDSLRPTLKDIMCDWGIEVLAHSYRRRHHLLGTGH